LLVVVLHSCPTVLAETIVINYTDRGWYDPIGRHFPSNTNYIVGDDRSASCGSYCNISIYNDYHNFFVFDLAAVTQPIDSATLAVFVPGPLGGKGFVSSDPSENYELHDVITPIGALVAGTGGVTAHTDLGSGVIYGSRTMIAADNGKVVEITLNSDAIAAMNSTHGLFGIGGSITTLDNLPNYEYTFGSSGVATEITVLRLTLMPEPSTLLLLGIGAISLLGYRKAKSHG
jgi:hypothetical protein